jgi:EAL domain-containing protein (putative c-di-GMP-specific phosphodiesterase class I)
VTPPAADPAVVVGATILVVDPHARLSGDIEGALASRGYTVEVASDARSIRPRLDQPQFDVIIADVSFPATGALGFMRAVRERDLDVPVVFVADRADGQKAAEAIEYGAFRVVRRPVDPETLLTIVRHAIGLHRIATLKRQAIEVTGADRHRLGDRAGLEVRFDNALTKLWLAFQPIVASTKQTVFGYEAFVRADEPALPTPSELFSAAEHLGRLHDLGRAIRTEVANAVTAAPPNVRIFVNVHAEDLADFDLFSPAAPLSAIANRVVLEITDRSSLYRVTNLPGRLAKLRALGFRICVDDLGAGYAGLSCFSQLEPEFGKLDGSLVRGVQASSRRRGVLRSMLELMGVDLGMVVVCEGVETAEEKAALIELGADLLQGHWFAPPSREFVVPVQ